MTPEHLDSDLVAAYAERRLARPDLTTVEAHLAECGDCRADLAAVAGMVAARRLRRRLQVITPLLAAAAVLAVVVVNQPRPDESAAVMRPASDADAERLHTLRASWPPSGAPVPREGLRFAWQPDGPDAVYEVTVTDGTGAALWRARTVDTVIVVPDSVAWPKRTTYHWWVDVLLSDGRVASTGVREFSLTP